MFAPEYVQSAVGVGVDVVLKDPAPLLLPVMLGVDDDRGKADVVREAEVEAGLEAELETEFDAELEDDFEADLEEETEPGIVS